MDLLDHFLTIFRNMPHNSLWITDMRLTFVCQIWFCLFCHFCAISDIVQYVILYLIQLCYNDTQLYITMQYTQ